MLQLLLLQFLLLKFDMQIKKLYNAEWKFVRKHKKERFTLCL